MRQRPTLPIDELEPGKLAQQALAQVRRHRMPISEPSPFESLGKVIAPLLHGHATAREYAFQAIPMRCPLRLHLLEVPMELPPVV